MNAAQANAISLFDFLKSLGYTPEKQRGHDHLYRSPFRMERTPSFHLHAADNLWYDFGAGCGGDVLDFVCTYLESLGCTHNVSAALRFLDDRYSPAAPGYTARPKRETVEDGGPALTIEGVHGLRHPALLAYLTDERMIPLDLARKYLVEVEVRNRNTGKTFHALGMENDDGGYELRTNVFKGCAGRKDVTVIRGATLPATDVHVFEGMMDLLSALADQKLDAFAGDMIVLHSLSCLSKALPYIENYESYTKVFSWLDNDAAGEKASALLRRIVQQQEHLTFCPMNATYTPCKDVNAARVARLFLPLLK